MQLLKKIYFASFVIATLTLGFPLGAVDSPGASPSPRGRRPGPTASSSPIAHRCAAGEIGVGALVQGTPSGDLSCTGAPRGCNAFSQF